MFVDKNNFTVRARQSNGSIAVLGQYSSEAEATAAFEMLFAAFSKQNTFRMPMEKQIQAFIIASQGIETTPDSYKGAKQQRHGGS